MRLFLNLIATLGLTVMLGSGAILLSTPEDKESPILLLVLALGLVAFGIPMKVFGKEVENAEAVKKNEIDRSRALESRLMGIKFQKWQEPLLALEPRVVTAGRQTPHKSKKSRQSKKNRHIAHTHRRNENEFRRLKSQSLEATVAGAAAPRTYRAR